LSNAPVLGVVRMAGSRSPWRALRPALLAGAATLTWLTFSSPAASADALSDTASLLGGVTTGAVSSVTATLAGPAPAAPATSSAPAASVPLPAAAPSSLVPSSPVAVPSSGLLQPLVGQVSGLVDGVVTAVPVVNQVVPAGAVAAVAVPVAGVADGATAGVVDVVVPPVAAAVPVLEPVLQPVSDLATGTTPLPVTVPELPIVAVDEEQPHGTAPSAADEATAVTDDTENAAAENAAPSGAVSAGAAPSGPPVLQALAVSAVQVGTVPGAVALAGTSGPSRAGVDAAEVVNEQPGTTDPSPAPAPSPAVPGSGTGSGASSAGAAGAAAWLSPFTFDLPMPGALRAGDAPEHSPAPVSFDPGSSPD
jgi:hypothetical protein